MPSIVVALVIFVGLGAFFLFFHLVLGMLVRPRQGPRAMRPGTETDKLTIYECGEPTIGSAWVQFDLRYYVVALLFVIFDVEVAFFFPWAIVFGKANTLAVSSTYPFESADQAQAARVEQTKELGITALKPTPSQQAAFAEINEKGLDMGTARALAWSGFWDIMVFFGVLMVGFAYLWKRGDINWVRSVLGERTPEVAQEFPAATNGVPVRAEVPAQSEAVGAGH